MTCRPFPRRAGAPSLSRKRGPQTLLVLAVLGLAVLLAGCRPESNGESAGPRYHCPMHPSYVSDRPGECPICHMDLVPIGGASTGSGAHAATDESVHGRVTIHVSPEKRQRIGLRHAPVEFRRLTNHIRATGIFEHDERRLRRVAPRFGGFVRELHASFTGEHVVEGAPLLSVYSPDLLAAENEYHLAWRRWSEVADQPDTPAAEAARALLESARRRLTLWEVPEEDLLEIQERGPRPEVVIRSPVSGHILRKSAVAGGSFAAGETLYELAPLSPIWLRVAIFEADLPFVRIGQSARITVPHLGDHSFEGVISFAYPHVDPATRRASVRIEVPNLHHELLPDMWATVEITVPSGEVLAAPASGILDTGLRSIAFVVRDDGHMEPREVQTGRRAGDWIEVLNGLDPGEQIVTRALFLVDSESQMRAAIAAMTADEHSHH